MFVFRFDDFISYGKIKLTKQNLLSVSSSLYDPLGIISPITASQKLQQPITTNYNITKTFYFKKTDLASTAYPKVEQDFPRLFGREFSIENLVEHLPR